MYCGPENIFLSINNSIRHGNAFFPENTARKRGGSLSSAGKRKKKEPEDSRGILYCQMPEHCAVCRCKSGVCGIIPLHGRTSVVPGVYLDNPQGI